MSTNSFDIRMFLPDRITSREQLLPLLRELNAELDRIGEHLDAAFARCEAEAAV